MNPSSTALQVSKSIGAHMPTRCFSTAEGNNVTVDVPTMGESISEGTVVEWLKAPGDAVQVDDVVVVLETDKVSVDVRAPSAGVMVEHLAALEDNVEVGKPLFTIEAGEVPAASENVAPTAESEAPAAGSSGFVAEGEAQVDVPTMGESITE